MDELTPKIIEVLSKYDALVAWYKQRITDLAQEYDHADELIRMIQLRSPQPGDTTTTINNGTHKELDAVYLAVERQRTDYQDAIATEIAHVIEEYRQIQAIHLCYLQLPQQQQAILKALYTDGKSYKEIVSPGLSVPTINRIRKKAIENIKRIYTSGKFKGNPDPDT